MIRRFIMAVFLPVVIARGFMQLTGCASALKEVESFNDPSDDAKLSKCRKEGREAKAATDSGAAGGRAYEACMQDAGFR